jgi:hypothetical protein
MKGRTFCRKRPSLTPKNDHAGQAVTTNHERRLIATDVRVRQPRVIAIWEFSGLAGSRWSPLDLDPPR